MADTVKSIFRQRKVAGKYVTDLFGETYLKKIDKVIADDVIGEYDIDIPLLEKNEEFFLADIMQIVVIKKRLRSSDGSITYYVEDEIVETEDQKKKLEEMYDELLREFRDYKREYKYKNKFFNSGSDKAPNDRNGRI
jgi:hypothetical protein|nr:MAG TPA: hypothetical protein [Caudoviricetes sp.]